MSETLENVAVFSSGLYRHAQAFKKEDGTTYYSNPERIPYEERDDTIIHTCYGGEYLWDLANLYYQGVHPVPFDLAEIIAQFQPNPIVDWSVPMIRGREVLIPSVEYIEEVAYGDSLLDQQEL